MSWENVKDNSDLARIVVPLAIITLGNDNDA